MSDEPTAGRRRRPLLLAIAALAAVGVLAAGAVWWRSTTATYVVRADEYFVVAPTTIALRVVLPQDVRPAKVEVVEDGRSVTVTIRARDKGAVDARLAYVRVDLRAPLADRTVMDSAGTPVTEAAPVGEPIFVWP